VNSLWAYFLYGHTPKQEYAGWLLSLNPACAIAAFLIAAFAPRDY
jgi:hypothetical protein